MTGGEIMPVKPMIESVGAFLNGVYRPPGRYAVKKGDHFSFTVDISGYDGAFYEQTNCCVWLLDKKTNKAVWSRNFSVYKGEILQEGGGINIDRNMDLVFQTWYWENGWKFADQKGDWVFSLSSSPSTPSCFPKPKISRNETFFLLPPDYEEYCYPGTYTVPKGSKVLFELAVNNAGCKGTCYGWLVNEKGKELWSKQFPLDTVWDGTGSLIINEETTLKFQTWYWNGEKWVFYDQYGSWTFKLEEAKAANPVIDRQQTYLLIDGKRQPNPPIDVTAHPGSNLEAILTVVNKGGRGKCVFMAYDAIRGGILKSFEKTMSAGERDTIRFAMPLTRNIGFKWFVYRVCGWHQLCLTDEMG